jgi:hypothetical protein
MRANASGCFGKPGDLACHIFMLHGDPEGIMVHLAKMTIPRRREVLTSLVGRGGINCQIPDNRRAWMDCRQKLIFLTILPIMEYEGMTSQ